MYDCVGEINFEFKVIELCDKNNLKEREQFFIDKLKPCYNTDSFSDSPKGNCHMKGKKLSKETIIKTSGTNCIKSKLSKSDISEIRIKYKPRIYSSYKLAKEYGVSRQAINGLINKKHYKYE